MTGKGEIFRVFARVLIIAQLMIGIGSEARAQEEAPPSLVAAPTCAEADGSPKELLLKGSSFSPGVTVTLLFDGEATKSIAADSTGGFETSLVMIMSPGSHQLRAIEEVPQPDKSASASLQVPCPQAIGPPIPPQAVQPISDLPAIPQAAPSIGSEFLSQLVDAQRMLDQAVAEYEFASVRLEELEESIESAQDRLRRLNIEGQLAEERLSSRAASIYKANGVSVIASLLSAESLREAMARLTLYRAGMGRDTEALNSIIEARKEAIDILESLRADRADQETVLAEANSRQMQAIATLQELYRQTGNVTDVSSVLIALGQSTAQFVFPVFPPYSYSDSWQAPRMEGTRYYHLHEGTDIFAPAGTPVLASVDGVVENLGNATLGGIKLWIRSTTDGWTYYYAHLSAYAPGIVEGSVVTRGQVVGYVGNTGNARWTLPHLHYEMHDPFGVAINPYPVLRATDARSFGELSPSS